MQFMCFSTVLEISWRHLGLFFWMLACHFSTWLQHRCWRATHRLDLRALIWQKWLWTPHLEWASSVHQLSPAVTDVKFKSDAIDSGLAIEMKHLILSKQSQRRSERIHQFVELVRSRRMQDRYADRAVIENWRSWSWEAKNILSLDGISILIQINLFLSKWKQFLVCLEYEAACAMLPFGCHRGVIKVITGGWLGKSLGKTSFAAKKPPS